MKKKKANKRKLKEENPIYLKIDCEAALNSKKELLSYQMSLINIVKSIKKYRLLREKEEHTRGILKNSLKLTAEDIRKIELKMPQIESLKSSEKEIQKQEPKIEYYSEDLDLELEKIKRKLEGIGK
jgi:hypothetical protein